VLLEEPTQALLVVALMTLGEEMAAE